jgi:hypothetical protein
LVARSAKRNTETAGGNRAHDAGAKARLLPQVQPSVHAGLARPKGATMNEEAKSPSAMTTRPLGNTAIRPSVLERGIGENVAAHMKNITPDATRALREMLERKRQGQDGHARG